MLRFLYTILVLSAFCTSGLAQYEGVEKEVMKPIHAMFNGMALGDSAMISAQFEKEITMATIFRNQEGKSVLRRENSLDGFLKAVAGKHEPYNEPIWNVSIKIEGDLALVSCDYAFYLGNTFSHCGIDAWQLIKRDNGWKIFHLVDTRKKEGCDVPADVKEKYK